MQNWHWIWMTETKWLNDPLNWMNDPLEWKPNSNLLNLTWLNNVYD